MFWKLVTNLAVTIPGAVFTTSGTNPITGHFTWNTSVSDSGFYVFIVSISDDGCPIKGQQIYSYTIEVEKPPVDCRALIRLFVKRTLLFN
jgi:hypothetical protein